VATAEVGETLGRFPGVAEANVCRAIKPQLSPAFETGLLMGFAQSRCTEFRFLVMKVVQAARLCI